MNADQTPQPTSARAFIVLYCIAEPALNVVTGLWGVVEPVSFGRSILPSLAQQVELGATPEMMSMTRLAALMILVLGPLERIALLHGSRSLRVLFLAGLLFGDFLHLGATLVYEAGAGGWSATGIAALALACLLASSRIFYLTSGKTPNHPRYDAVESAR